MYEHLKLYLKFQLGIKIKSWMSQWIFYECDSLSKPFWWGNQRARMFLPLVTIDHPNTEHPNYYVKTILQTGLSFEKLREKSSIRFKYALVWHYVHSNLALSLTCALAITWEERSTSSFALFSFFNKFYFFHTLKILRWIMHIIFLNFYFTNKLLLNFWFLIFQE